MKTGFLIKILAWESRVVFEQLAVAVRVFIGKVGTKCMGVFPAPDGCVALVHDHSRGVEMIGVDKVNQDRAGRGGFLDHGHRNIPQPDGFLPDQPVVCRCGRAGVVPVFANQLPRRIIEKEKLGTQRAIFADALIQGVGFVRVRFSVLDRRREFSSGVPGEGGSAVVQRIPGGIVAVDLGDRACHIE